MYSTLAEYFIDTTHVHVHVLCHEPIYGVDYSSVCSSGESGSTVVLCCEPSNLKYS